VILGFSELLMTDASIMDASRITDMARHINTAGMRLYRLIENFLTYSQTELLIYDQAKREALRRGYLVYPTMSIEGNARAKAQSVERIDDLSFDLEQVESVGIAEEYLKKIVEELIDNAAKFSNPGTPIHVTGEVEGDRYLFCVSDQGRGMSPEEVDSIGAYMQFQRRLYEQQGSGLGLVISKRFVELHDGEFTIESELGKGTRVCVRLPIRKGEV
jgi:signal transduction histidine kinase